MIVFIIVIGHMRHTFYDFTYVLSFSYVCFLYLHLQIKSQQCKTDYTQNLIQQKEKSLLL